MRNFTSGKSHVWCAARASCGFKMVLFTEPSEGLCLPSALLVVEFYRNLRTLGEDCNFTIFATTSLYHETSKVTLKSDNTFFAKVNGTDTGRTDRQMDEG